MQRSIAGTGKIRTRLGFMLQVPSDAKQGDVVGFFAGEKVAYLLRPNPSSVFKLVRECYVYSL